MNPYVEDSQELSTNMVAEYVGSKLDKLPTNHQNRLQTQHLLRQQPRNSITLGRPPRMSSLIEMSDGAADVAAFLAADRTHAWYAAKADDGPREAEGRV